MAVERSSLPEQVFQQLVTAVLDGRYAPGERLPAQRALAQDLGVNMASLREGIKRLEQLRLVDVRHGDAMRVQDWRTSAGLDVLAHAVTVDPALTGALFEARRLLLREAARLAAGRRTEEQAAVLVGIAQALADAEDDATAQMIDLAFMATVIDASHNLVFSLILNSIRELYLNHLERFRPIVTDRAELLPHYARAAQAIAGGEATRAAGAVEKLAADQERRMLEAER
jgi:GntR family transcriptional regulator, transcriptional repressor for pyruvate dehydrogenase complex